MADHVTVDFNSPPTDDYAAHLQSYESFLTVTKWGTIVVVVALILMAFFLI